MMIWLVIYVLHPILDDDPRCRSSYFPQLLKPPTGLIAAWWAHDARAR
jgi:hypothetical protein